MKKVRTGQSIVDLEDVSHTAYAEGDWRIYFKGSLPPQEGPFRG